MENQIKKEKIICSNYFDSSHALVNELYPSIANIPFDKYFYSPKLNTCIVGIIKKENILNENKEQTSYLILDTLSNKEVWFAFGTHYYQPQNEREIEITQTDFKYQSEYNSKLFNLQ